MVKKLELIVGQAGGGMFLKRSLATEGHLSVLEAATASVHERRVAVRAIIAEALRQKIGVTEPFRTMLRRALSDDVDWLEEQLERVPSS